MPDDEVEPFDLVCYDPLINSLGDSDEDYAEDPADESNGEEGNSVSTYVIGNRTEGADVDLSLTGLTKTQIERETDGTHFKNIINVEGQTSKNRAYLYPIIDSRYDPFPDGHELYVNMQGSCTDGEYVYYAFFIAHKYKENPTDKEYKKVPLEICIVSGYFDETNEFVTTAIRFSGDMLREDGLTQADELKHANDITYNSLQDKLVISCSELGYHNMVYLMDAAYFRGETDVVPTAEKHALSCMISAIAYSERYNKYVAMVAATDAYFVYFDRDFNLIGGFNNIGNKQYEVAKTEYELSHQGITCDENYIYATYCEIINEKGTVNDEILNTLVLFDWEGNRVKEINLEFILPENLSENEKFPSGRKVLYEIEGISILNDRIVVGFNAFWHKNKGDTNSDEYLKPYFYQYDMSHLCFNIKYCPDDSVASYVNANNMRSNTVIHGISTNLLENTYMNNGKKFIGWQLYSPRNGKWRYWKDIENSDDDLYGWYIPGDEPEGYVKKTYDEKTSVKQTVPAGWDLLLCTVWEETDDFYITYKAPGATLKAEYEETYYDEETDSIKEVTSEVPYGTFTPLLANVFEKTSAAGNPVAFKGWNPYSPEVNKWYYESNSQPKQRGWYVEGEEPTGYTKALYTDQVEVKQTTKKGGHITMFAVWDEFTIYYDANGQLIKPMHIKMPTVVHKGGKPTTQLNMYEVKSVFPCAGIQTPDEFEGYYQYLVEDECWRYVEGSNDKVWLPQSDLPRYIYEYSTISNGLGAGRRVVFSAAWS